jgi:solute carrier family 35 (adenosine 3'-phospho 5'-phosphosulfate transporter), member B3
MLIATFMHHARFSSVEYACAVAVCTGLILFAAADWTLTGPSFHPIGLLLVTTSVVADAFLPNAQERLFRFGSSRLEVTLYTNIFSLVAYTASTMASGDLRGCIALCRSNSQLTLYFSIYTLVAYFAISFHMTVVKRFGGVAAVVVATGRKGLTLILSFVLFPKAFSWFYPAGATLVLGGILVASLFKMNNKKKKNQQQQSNDHDNNSSNDRNQQHSHQNGTTTTSSGHHHLELENSVSSFDAKTPSSSSPLIEADVLTPRSYLRNARRPLKSHLSDIETPPPSMSMK